MTYQASPVDWQILENRAPSLTATRALLELRARVEALEAAQQQPPPMVDTGWCEMSDGSPIMEPAPPAPAEGLVKRVAVAIGQDGEPHNWSGEARAAIREVATWLRSELISRGVADRLEQEAER